MGLFSHMYSSCANTQKVCNYADLPQTPFVKLSVVMVPLLPVFASQTALRVVIRDCTLVHAGSWNWVNETISAEQSVNIKLFGSPASLVVGWHLLNVYEMKEGASLVPAVQRPWVSYSLKEGENMCQIVF